MKNVENRDPLPQSDHHPFHVKGVPAIFFLTKGASGRGHTPDDTYDKLPLYSYDNFFKLVTEIPEELRKQEVKKGERRKKKGERRKNGTGLF